MLCNPITIYCVFVQMRTCRSWLWSSFSWDLSVRWGFISEVTTYCYQRTIRKISLTSLPFHFRAISLDSHLFSKRPSLSFTAGMVLSIRWLFPHSRGLARPSFSLPHPFTAGLAFASPPSCRKAFARTEEEALVWLQIPQPVLVSSSGKSCH